MKAKSNVLAAVLLLAFAVQCAWLIYSGNSQRVTHAIRAEVGSDEAARLHSPLIWLVQTVPARMLYGGTGASSPAGIRFAQWMFIPFGVVLGGSVWYIARRLYGRAAGYIALTLYAFSPAMILGTVTMSPGLLAAFGVFGTVWTGIAVAHTLYAPREVVLWNWRRIVLLGVAIAVAVGAQFSTALVIILTLAFMFYLVPHRKSAAVTIVGAAVTLALVMLFAIYGFRPVVFVSALVNARWASLSLDLAAVPAAWKMLGFFLLRNSAGFSLLLAIALATFAGWRHTRFFGTAAPLITAATLIVLMMLMPVAAGAEFFTVALPFLFVFVAGVCADLLEHRVLFVRSMIAGIVIAVVATHALFSIFGLRSVSSPRQTPVEHPSNTIPGV